MDIKDVFRSKAQHLFWHQIPSDHADLPSDEVIEKNQAYYSVRMREMYIRYSRKLWREMYPMLHAYVDNNGEETHAVVGPGQLRDLGERNLDRIVNLNHRLSGPTVFSGGEVSILIGLYSVPGEDASKALMETVSLIAKLGGVALGPSVEIANVVKTGVEKIVGLDKAQLELGIRDSFFQNKPLKSGYYVGISAPENEVDQDSIWLDDEGRLKQGEDPISGKRYEDHDYMVLEIERTEHRDDWPGLPEIKDFEKNFSKIMKDSSDSVDEKRKRLGDIWPQFKEALSQSQYLTEPDSYRILQSVEESLKIRLAAMDSGNPFETKSWGDDEITRKDPADFSFIDVPDYADLYEYEDLHGAGRFVDKNPFSA